jgi:hypothetical protein
MKETDQPKSDDRILKLFDGLDESSDMKPLTSGLGFKDKVSDGVYTMEVENNASLFSDAGTLDIGGEEMGDGVLNIKSDGELQLETAESIQPILFHSGHDGLIKRSAKKSGESLFGALIDFLLVGALAILTSAILTEFSAFKFNLDQVVALEPSALLKVFTVFAALFLAYKIFTRVFFGKTLGEWSSRHQLGLLVQQHRWYYPLQVFIRETVVLLTGVFTLAVISKILDKDLCYGVSGLETYMEQKKKK